MRFLAKSTIGNSAPGLGYSPNSGPPQGGLGMMPIGTFFGDPVTKLLPNELPRGSYGRAFGFGSAAEGTATPRTFTRGLRFGDTVFVAGDPLWPNPTIGPIGGVAGGLGGVGAGPYGGALGPGLWGWPMTYGSRRRSRSRRHRRHRRPVRSRKYRSRR